MDTVEPGKTFKIIRDPIHNIIRIEERFVLALLDTAPMQRLRRVRQLGLACLVFPGAEHSRFTHSLGAYHLAGRVLRQLTEASKREGRDDPFTPVQRNAVLAAALLHDVGHGPFSHVFELALSDVGRPGIERKKHAEWSVQIIRENPEIHAILSSLGPEVPDLVREILLGTAQPLYVQAIVDSQLDVDRFDYLLRDSQMTGTRYGQFDIEWMLRTLTIHSIPRPDADGDLNALIETVVVDGRRGLSDLERYVLGRHHMYSNVYYHKTVRAAERMLRAILMRAADLIRVNGLSLGNAAFQRLARGEDLSIDDYMSLDDFLVMSWIAEWARGGDSILSDLSGRLLSRRLFKTATSISVDQGDIKRINDSLREIAVRLDLDPHYYVLVDELRDVAYKDQAREIWYVDREGKPLMLSKAPKSLMAQYLREVEFVEYRWAIPMELVEQVKAIPGVLVGGSSRNGEVDGDV